ncbi:MAG: DNA repair protein, partial [Ignavibacteriae bacterium]|nr:DNA repair protein [Ignavibacteriota bacterium]
GVSGCIVDCKCIFQSALTGNASSIIIAHNHPSGNLKASGADMALTRKVAEGAKVLDITLLDHLILTPSSFLSFADEGML